MAAGDDLAVRVHRVQYEDVDDAAAEVSARLAVARGAAVSDGELVSEIAAAALSATLPPDLDSRVANHRRAREDAHALAEVLERVAEHLAGLREQRARLHADRALDEVRAEVSAIVDQAGPVLAELPDDVVSADSAVNARCEEKYRDARDLAIRYARARSIQSEVVTGAGKAPTSRFWPGFTAS